MLKIVADSGCDIRKEQVENEGCVFESVPLNLHVEDRVYVDDENINVEEFLKDMENSPVVAKTASPSPSLFLEKFKEMESVFVITLSSKLSGTYQSAMTAKKMYFEEYGKKFIHIFDSLSASIGEGLIAMKIVECAKKGFDNREIVEQVSHFIKGMRTYFLLEKFDTLVKSGRMNPYIAKIASMLNIRPICGENGAGEIKMLDKARGHGKAVKRLIEIIKANTPD
ncbi:MAG: DegV family protein, partial [Clostridiales bacterium]|nr:DegV family protein [Clostridiales bacterium]